MEQFDIDWPALRVQFIRLAMVAVASFLLVWLSGGFRDKRAGSLDEAARELRAAEHGYREAVRAAHAVHTHHGSYRKLAQTGFIGEEQRLLWIESLRDAAIDEQIFNLQFRLGQQEPFRGDLGNPGTTLGLYASAMNLQLKLAHEGELLRFLNGVENRGHGLFDISRCTLTPTFPPTGPANDAPNVFADCELLWYTVRETTPMDMEEGF